MSCAHENVEVAELTEDRMGFEGHYQVDHRVYVCSDCGAQVEGDPDLDAAEARADMHIDQERGK